MSDKLMRKIEIQIIINLFLIVLSLLMSSCQNQKHTTNLYTFDTINLDLHPKKGLDSLETYLPLIDKMSKNERMVFELRYNLSRGKNFLSLPEDTIIKSYIKYFENKQDTKRVLESYLLLSYVYFDLSDYDKVDENIQKGIDTPNAEHYPRQLAHLYSTQGAIFQQTNLDSLANISFNKAHKLYIKSNDSIMLAGSYKDLGVLALKLGHSREEALSYLYKSLEIAQDNQDMTRVDWVLPVIAYVYLQEGDIEKVQQVLNQFSSSSNSQLTNKYLIFAKYYQRTGNFELMRNYCDSLIQLGTWPALVQGHNKLYSAYEEQKKYKEAFHHLESYMNYNDSLYNKDRATKLFQIESKYQNKLLRSKNQLLEAKQTATMRGIWALIFITLILGGLAYTWYTNHMRKKVLESKRNELRQKNLHDRSLQHIENMKQENEVLKAQIKENKSPAVELDQQTVKVHLLEARIKKAEMDRELRAPLEQQLFNMEVYKKVMRLANGSTEDTLSKDEWLQLETAFEQTYDNLLFTFKQIEYINQDEIRLCCLAKLGVPNKGISILLGKAESTVSTMKPRVYKKITGKKGSTNDFYQFINGL